MGLQQVGSSSRSDVNHAIAKLKFTVALVGLGRVGMGYDSQLPEMSHVLSHLRAIQCSPDFRLLAASDPNLDNQRIFTGKTTLPAYTNVEEMLRLHQPDVLIVASPTETHSDVISTALKQSAPRAILCEKPIAGSLYESKRVVDLCAKADVRLFVNFIRRADPGVHEVRKRIEDGRIAMPLKAFVWYSKGMLHNGSHFVDLMTYWMGPVQSARIVSRGRSFGCNDVEPDFLLEHQGGSALFCAAKEEYFSHYTVEMLAPNGRLRYERGGEIVWQGVEMDDNLVEYRRLSHFVQSIPNGMNKYQLHVMNELAQALKGNFHELCTGEDALISQEWLEQLCMARI